jgi:hypothetical protein
MLGIEEGGNYGRGLDSVLLAQYTYPPGYEGYTYWVKQSKHIVKSKPARTVDLAAIESGSQPIAYSKPVPGRVNSSQITAYEQREVTNRSGKGVIDGVNWPPDWKGKAAETTGGRSEVSIATPKVTAKPLPLLSKPVQSLLPDQNGTEMVTTSNNFPNPPLTSASDMPVLGDPMGVHQKEDPKVVQTSHVGGVHSKNSPVLGHKESDLVTTSLNVPYSPDVKEPLSTEEVSYGSPFITGNDRIDRRTAFTQYCRDGESRTYMKVAERMAVSLETIKEWAKEDNWENAYRERITADIVQVAKEENIHEYLDAKKAMISLIKGKVMEAQAGKDVFRNTKELIDTMVKLEELTGAGSVGNVRPGQIFVIISEDEWRAREVLNEKARKEEAEKA